MFVTCSGLYYCVQAFSFAEMLQPQGGSTDCTFPAACLVSTCFCCEQYVGWEGGEVVKLHTFLITATDGGGMLWRSWLRHCATSQEVAGSNRDAEIGILH